ncbi:MAG TPA: hypothetical protein VFU81_22975 [Thermomicrobiales bacterium]|nr:hypothetical protein [Thermomicrobiales bacterium]
MPSLLARITRRNLRDPEIPVCPVHDVQMRLRGVIGRPTRFADQTEEEYTFIYFCPIEECNVTDSRVRTKSQIPVPGVPPERPTYARDRSVRR